MSNLATIVNNILADSGIDDLNVVVTTGSYANPAWITTLSWSKITSTPTTLAGYGITNAVPSTRTITINGVAQDLSVDRSWTIAAGVSSVTASGAGITASPTTGAVVISNTGVTSNVAGTGISVSGATGAVTITNTGVTSIVAGTGISISGATGAVTVTNSGVTSVNGSSGAITGIATTASIGNGTLTLAVSGTGLSGSASFTANQSGNSTFTVTSNATNLNTASTIVARDASGNFSAGTITATLSGSATSVSNNFIIRADSGTTEGTDIYTFNGSAAKNINFVGGSNITITKAAGQWTIAASQPTVNNGTLTLAVAGTGLSGSATFTANQSGNSTFTVTSNATSANTASTIVARDASGNFSAGTITAALTGTASGNVLSRGQSNWSGSGVIDNVVGLLAWKNYGNAHVIFDASAGTSPSGGSVNNTNSAAAWTSTYPTLMGWNGSQTYGVRVDSARVSDNTTGNSATTSQTNFTSLTVNSNTVLHAGNYNSYSPTLTGGGASGTWSINITGSAGSASSASSVPWTGVSAGTRTNYTLRFQPPASDYAGFEFNTSSGGGAGYFLIRGTSDSDVYTAEGITLVADAGWLTLAQRTASSKGVRIMTGTTSAVRASFATDGSINFTGDPIASSSFRAPIFYDSANTGYYLDPAGTSRLGGGTDSDVIQMQNSNWGAWLMIGGWSTDTTHARIRVSNGNLHMDARGGGYDMYLNWYTNRPVYFGGDQQVSGTIYDYANNAYYLKASSSGTSLSIAGKIVTAVNSGTIISHGAMTDAFGYNGSYGTYIGSPVGGTYYIYANGTFYDNGTIRTFLHSGNYNSYSPTLTGGGASGTWSINITGNAGYASSAGNADTVDGYHATAFPYRSGGSSGYYQVADWMQFNTTAGIFWPSYNGAHIYANTSTSYGSIRIDGSRNGWRGIVFDGSVNLMMNDNETGHYKVSYGWQWRWYQGTMYVSRSTYGGGTEYTMWDSGNLTNLNQLSNGPGYITSSSNVVGLYSSGFGSNNFTWYQSPTPLSPYTGSWASYLVSNHGDGATYYNQTIVMPFWGPPQYFRKEGGTNVGPYTFWTTENLNAYAVNMNQYVRTTDSPTFDQLYVNGWFRNNTNNTGLYNQNTTMHLSSTANGYWDMSSTTSVSSIRFYTGGHLSALRGYVYANNSNEIGFLNTAGNWSLRVDNSGNATATGDVTAYSDARVKENVITVDNALDKVLNLRGVYYNRIDSEDKRRKVGVIAQEIMEVVPEVVGQDNDGMYNVSYGNIVGVLIEAIKEQQKQIDELKQMLK
jgi:hypothetical protein